MLDINELNEHIEKIIQSIESGFDSSVQLSIYAFTSKYEKKENKFNFPSYRINVKTKDAELYAKTLLLNANSILKKYSEIKPFNSSNNKTTIDYVNLNQDTSYSSKINDCISKITKANIQKFSEIKKLANCIAVHIKYNNQDVFLFAKGIPYVKTPKFIFMVNDINEQTFSVNYNLKFPMSLSACLFNKEVYLLGSPIAAIFGFENSLKEQMNEAMDDILGSGIFTENSFKSLKEYSSCGKNYYCYNNFDKTKLDSLKNNNASVVNFLEKYKIEKDGNGLLILDNDEKRKVINKFLCNDYKRDFVNTDQVYDAPGNEVID